MSRPPQSGGYQLLKLGLANSLDAGSFGQQFRVGNAKMLERVFGANRVGFYKALMDSVRDFKATTRKTDKRSDAIKTLRHSKEEMATLAKSIRDQLAAIAPEKLSRLTQSVNDRDRKVRTLNDLLAKASKISDEMIQRKFSRNNDDDDDFRGRRQASIPMEFNKYLTRDMTTTRELEDRIRADLAAAEAEQADTSSVASAITAISATQSFLADAGALILRTKALAKMSELRPDEELARDEVVLTAGATELNADFFTQLFGKIKALTQKVAPFDPVNTTVSPVFDDKDANVMTKGLERYRGAVENILRFLNNNARETDDAIRALESKSPISSSKVPSVSDVRAIYNAHLYDRQQRMRRVSEVAIELRNLVRKMESARRDRNAPDITEDLRKRKETEFNYECLRIQKKIDKELDDYPEMREMYIQICDQKKSS